MGENKKDISESYNSIFDENIPTPTEESNNRDYLGSLYDGGIELLDSDIRMTRSEYIKKHTEITENFKKERRETAKLLLGAVISYVVPYLGQFAVKQILSSVRNPYAAGIFRGIRMIFIVLMVAVPIIISVSLIKRIRLLRKNENHALRNLEQRKQELMLLGQYDAGK